MASGRRSRCSPSAFPRTAAFNIDGAEFDLYNKVTRFVKAQSRRAAADGDSPRARAVGFLMSLYQRRLASSTFAMRRSLENRAKRLADGLEQAQVLASTAPPTLPDVEELEEMEDAERERLERMLDAITLAGNAEQVRDEVEELRHLAAQAKAVENAGDEAKLTRLRQILREQGFFERPDQRLLLFTEFTDTLNYLMANLRGWGFAVGCIHGGMKPGARDESGTPPARGATVPGRRYSSAGGHRSRRAKASIFSAATSCSTTTSRGTPTAWSSAWGASTATASATTA